MMDLDMKYILHRMSAVFTADMDDAIMAQSIRADQVRTFLKMLPKRGPDSFTIFLIALESDYPFLKTQLEKSLQAESLLSEQGNGQNDKYQISTQLLYTHLY